MKKYKVMNNFKDKYTNKEYIKDSVIELDEARAKEVLAYPNFKLIEEVEEAKPKATRKPRAKKVDKETVKDGE